MPRYFFNLHDGRGGIDDPDGAPLSDDAAASLHARAVACELLQNRERQTRDWLLDVTDESGRGVLQLRFATVDRTLDHLGPERRKLIEQGCENRLALKELDEMARMTMCRSRASLARARGQPYLVSDRWGKRVA